MTKLKESPSRSKRSLPIRSSRVLIVDDHELLREGMRLLIDNEPDLELCGEAATEPEALRLHRRLHPEVTIVDITLKQGNGIELIKRIKALDPHARIVVSSMHDEKIYGERAWQAGAMAYVCKQEPAYRLLEAVRRVRDGKTFFSEALTERLLQRASPARGDQPPSLVESLSNRELEVFELLGRGLSSSEIAETLHLSAKTVETYRQRMKTKLNLRSSRELSYHAMRWSLENE